MAVLVVFWRPLRDLAHGYLILYDHLYTRGERVRLGEREGVVQEVQLRWTHLVDDEGTPIFIPNSQVGEVVNLSRRHRPAAEDEEPSS